MPSAPPVSVRGTGGRGWWLVQVALHAAASASVAAWALGWSDLQSPWKPLLVALAAAAGAGAAWRRRAADASLVWDGQEWRLDGTPGRYDIMIDLGRWLLLRFVPNVRGRERWPAIGAAEAGAAWHGLRVALHARAPTGAAADSDALDAADRAGR